MKHFYSIFFLLTLNGMLLFGQNSGGCKQVYVDHLSAENGDQVCVDVKVRDFKEMLGIQLSLSWNPE